MSGQIRHAPDHGGEREETEEEQSRRKRHCAEPAKIGSKLAPHLEAQLDAFWKTQHDEQVTLHSSGPKKPDFKTIADLPLSRVKRVMKADGDVRMISAEAPVVFARACQMFILDLTLRGWFEANEKDRRTIQREDIHDAIVKADVFDFLVDVVNGVLEQEKEEMRHRRLIPHVSDASERSERTERTDGDD
jgi:histone H3/H4